LYIKKALHQFLRNANCCKSPTPSLNIRADGSLIQFTLRAKSKAASAKPIPAMSTEAFLRLHNDMPKMDFTPHFSMRSIPASAPLFPPERQVKVLGGKNRQRFDYIP